MESRASQSQLMQQRDTEIWWSRSQAREPSFGRWGFVFHGIASVGTPFHGTVLCRLTNEEGLYISQ
jgi:hypothetical protein